MKKLTIIAVAVTLTLGIGSAFAGDAKEIWEKSCATCHGKDGKAEGPMGKKLSIRDYSNAKVQGELKDADMITAIKEGVKKDGKQVMKGFSDKVSDDEAKALVAYIRGLKK